MLAMNVEPGGVGPKLVGSARGKTHSQILQKFNHPYPKKCPLASLELLSKSYCSFPVLRQADRIGEEDLRPFATLLLDPLDEGRHLLGLDGILIRLMEARVLGL